MLLDRHLLALVREFRGRLLLSTALTLAVSAARVVQAVLVALVVVSAIHGTGWPALVWDLAVIAVVIAIRAVLTHLDVLAGIRTAQATKRRVRDRLLRRLFDLGPGYAVLHRTGELRATVIDAVEGLEAYYSRFLPALVTAVVAPVGVLVYLVTVDPAIALIGLAAVLFAILAPSVFYRLRAESSKLVWGAIGQYDAEMVDSIQGLTTLKALGATGRRRTMLAERADRLRAVCMRELSVSLINTSLQTVGTVGGTALALIVAAAGVASGRLPVEAAILVLFVVAELFRPITDLAKHLHDAFGAAGAAGRIEQLLGAPAPAPAPERPAPVAAAELVPAISFQGVRFGYPGQQRPALDGIDLEIGAGERIAVVGPSGSGKSTLVNLLLRFVDPDEGVVRIGGHDLRELDPAVIRELVAVVSQDSYLFHGSIGENIALGRAGATDAEIAAAAEAAGLHEFVRSLPEQYGTPIGERGVQLSGGQRQRLAIARAVLKNAPIVILDEATSAVDAETEALIQDRLAAAMAGRTCLVIAHRLSTVRDADRIVVLADGTVAETGTHQQLKARGGRYTRLVAAQEAVAS